MVLTVARRRAAVARRRQRARVHQPRAGARESRQARSAATARLRAGKRAGRPRARAESRPAARLSPHRRSGGAPPCRGRLGHSGRRPARCRASRPTSCSTRPASPAASARCSSSGRIRWSRRRTRRTSIERLKRLDFLAVADFFLSETAELADVVLPSAQWAEEEGTDDQSRRARHPPPARHRSAGEVRTDIDILCAPRRSARQVARSSPSRVVERCLRRVARGNARRRRRLLRHHLRPHRPRRTACSGRARPTIIRARRGCSPDAFPTAERPCALSCGRARRPAEEPDEHFPCT